MCYVDDGDHATIWNEFTRTAKKRYVCCKCGLPILPGTVYSRIESLFERRWYSSTMHADCWELSQYIQRNVCGQDIVFAEGGYSLREEVAEHMCENDKVIPMYRRVLRARIREGTWPRRSRLPNAV